MRIKVGFSQDKHLQIMSVFTVF